MGHYNKKKGGAITVDNIYTYMDWRGDLSFTQDEWNEVDSIIFAQMVYVRFENIKNINWDEGITIRNVCKELRKIYKIKGDSNHFSSENSLEERSMNVLLRMGQINRYKDLLLTNFSSNFNEEAQEQYASITIHINKDLMVIAYRGTDDSLVGWKEDFNMFFMENVPAQISARNYADFVISTYRKKCLLTGHSKGGNLAVYSAVRANSKSQLKMIGIYNHDGPGFLDAMIEDRHYQKMLPKIVTIIPESSIVGRLLEHQEDSIIVRSSQNGRMQHDATSWEVKGKEFVRIPDTSKSSKLWDAAISSWLRAMPKEQLQVTVDALFSILTAAEMETKSDLSKDFLKKLPVMLKAMKELDVEAREYLTKTINVFWKESNKTIRTSKRNSEIKSLDLKK